MLLILKLNRYSIILFCLDYLLITTVFHFSLSSRVKLDDMYGNLPRALKSECLVRTKVEEDENVLAERRKIVESMSPAELGQLNSLSDIPMPSALEKIFKTSEKSAKQPDPEKRK